MSERWLIVSERMADSSGLIVGLAAADAVDEIRALARARRCFFSPRLHLIASAGPGAGIEGRCGRR